MGTKKKTQRAVATAKSKSKTHKRKSTPPRRKTKAKTPKIDVAALAVLNADKLRDLYATMVKCRLLAQHMQKAHTGSVFPGLEAMLAGAGAHVLPQDCIALERGGYVASLIKRTPLHLILARRQNGRPAAITMNSVLSLAADMKGKGAVTLMFCVREPKTLLFHAEAMAQAAEQKLPLVCLVETGFDSRLELPNQISPGTYVGADPGFYPRIPVDGNDVVGVFRVAQEAIRRAREGHGPAVIECLTSRPGTAESNAGAAQYTADDPVSFMQAYLQRRDLWSEEWAGSITADFKRALQDAASHVDDRNDRAAQFDNVYSADGRTHRTAAASAQENVVPTA